MAVMEHAYYASFGYQVTSFFAASRYTAFKPNTHRRRRRDETVEFRRVGGVYMNSQLAHDDCRRIRSTILKLTRLHSVWLHQFW